MFITPPSCLVDFHLTESVRWKWFVLAVYQFWKDISVGPALKYFTWFIGAGGHGLTHVHVWPSLTWYHSFITQSPEHDSKEPHSSRDKPYPSSIHHAKEPISSLYNTICCSKKAYSFRNSSVAALEAVSIANSSCKRAHIITLQPHWLLQKGIFISQQSPIHHSKDWKKPCSSFTRASYAAQKGTSQQSLIWCSNKPCSSFSALLILSGKNVTKPNATHCNTALEIYRLIQIQCGKNVIVVLIQGGEDS